MHRKSIFIPLLLMGLGGLHAQQAVERTSSTSAPREAYQSGWRQDQVLGEAEFWRTVSMEQPGNADAQLNWYRSERSARLSTNNGRLSAGDEQALDEIARKVEAAAPDGFEHHLTAYYQGFPAASAFEDLARATAIAPDRTELIGPQLNLAHMRGDKAGLDRWCREMDTRGQPSAAHLRAVADLLASTDRNAVLFTNGDLDTHLALLRQRRQDDRRDVLIVDQRLLADPGYRQRIWSEAKGKGPVPGAGPGYAKALVQAGERPVHLAMTLDRDWLDAFAGRLSTAGTAFRVDARISLAELDMRWRSMEKPMGALPMSRNYLLPGAVLLQGFRARGDETRTAQLELELRNMARSLGAESELVRAGVFQH